MKPIPIAQYLNQQARASTTQLPLNQKHSAVTAWPAPAMPNVEEIDSSAYNRGRREERERCREEFERTLVEECQKLKAELEIAHIETRKKEFTKLLEDLDQGLKQIEANISASVSRILRPFLGEVIAAEAVDVLTKQIAFLLSSDASPLIRISGPEYLLRDLKRRIPELAVRADFSETDAMDLTIESQSTVISTQIEEWQKHLNSLGIGVENG